MTPRQSDLLFLHQASITHYLISNGQIEKTAEFSLSGLKSAITSYFSGHWDPNDKTGSFLNAIVPSALSVLVGGWLGPVLGFGLRLLNVDIGGVLEDIYASFKNFLSGGNKTISPEQIDQTVQAAIEKNPKDQMKVPEKLEPGTTFVSSSSFEQDWRNAKILKLASQSSQSLMIVSAAGKGNLLKAALGFIFKTLAMSAGLMVAGDLANKALNRPNAFDSSENKRGIPQDTSGQKSEVETKATQKDFPLNPSYDHQKFNQSDAWVEKVPNTQTGIQNLLVSFGREVYQGLEGKDAQIKATPKFQALTQALLWFNRMTPGDPIVFIPKTFTSKQGITDYWIDQFAAQNKALSTKLPTQ